MNKKYDINTVKTICKGIGLELISKEYTSIKSNLEFKCPECGEIFKRSLDNLKTRRSPLCSYCGKKQIGPSQAMSYDEVKKDIEKDGSLLISKSYKNVDEKLEIRCRCGKSFKRSYYGYRISNRTCGCDNQTRGNKEVESFLIKNNIPYEKEYEFEDLKKLRFDFKIEHKNKICLVEYDGWFHFNNHARWNQLDRQQKADSRKNEYCIKKNIELIRIKYDSDSVEDKLKHLI